MAAEDDDPLERLRKQTTPMAQQIATLLESLANAAIFEGCASYKQHMVEAGFSEEIAQQMTLEFHRHLWGGT